MESTQRNDSEFERGLDVDEVLWAAEDEQYEHGPRSEKQVGTVLRPNRDSGFSRRIRTCPRPSKRFLTLIYGLILLLFASSVVLIYKHGSDEWELDKIFDFERGASCKPAAGSSKYLDDVGVKPGMARPKTERFRDALLPNQKYITSFVTAGWTNDVMSYIHLIQLSLLTNRIPVLPPFQPSHIGHWAGFIPFGDVFDTTRLSTSLSTPVLEWRDIKNFTTPHPSDHIHYEDYYGGKMEGIGCWSLWMTQWAGHLGEPREGGVPEALGLDVSWMPVPFGGGEPLWVGKDKGLDVSLHWLAELTFPQGRRDAIRNSEEEYNFGLRESVKVVNEKSGKATDDEDVERLEREIPVRSRIGHVQIPPDDQMVCFDFLYYVASYTRDEWTSEFTPAWNAVGTHLYFAPRILALAREMLLRAFGLSQSDSLPPFISVHVRRRDFSKACAATHVPLEECLAPFGAYVQRVQEVKDGVVRRFGIGGGDVRIVVLSDEPRTSSGDEKDLKEGRKKGDSERWWEGVKREGWASVDHGVERTEEMYGTWYPSILDAAMLSLANGFVGTDRSTYSVLAAKRVQDWAGGPVRLVKWGKVGADE